MIKKPKRKEIVCLGSKGGTGKSTFCQSLVWAINKQFPDTAVIWDLHPDKQSTSDCSITGEIPVVHNQTATRPYRIVLIDTGGFTTERYNEVIKSADKILVPTPLAPKTVNQNCDLISTLLDYRYKIDIVPNRVQKVRKTVTSGGLEILKQRLPNIRITKTQISDLTTFETVEYYGLEGKGYEQIKELIKELELI